MSQDVDGVCGFALYIFGKSPMDGATVLAIMT